jgi:hypothetical protein
MEPPPAPADTLVSMPVYPNQNVRLVVEMRDDRFARGALRKIF